eukprot:1147680-Pelagomonas_calceolata.AAC.2
MKYPAKVPVIAPGGVYGSHWRSHIRPSTLGPKRKGAGGGANATYRRGGGPGPKTNVPTIPDKSTGETTEFLETGSPVGSGWEEGPAGFSF